MEQIRKIFESFVGDDTYFIKPGLQPKLPLHRLSQLKARLSELEYNEVEDLVFAACSAGELQGFINGFTYHQNQVEHK